MRIRKQKHKYVYKHIEKHKVKPIRFTVEDVNRFWTDGMFYFLIGTYISADTLYEENDYKVSHQKLTDILKGLKSDECLIPEDDRTKNIHRVEDCMTLVQNEYKDIFGKKLV